MNPPAKIAERFPKGFFIAGATAAINAARRLSIGQAIGRQLSRNAAARVAKLPAWIGDAYQLTWLIFTAVTLAVLARVGPPAWAAWLIGGVLAYRLFELGFFLLGWVLVDSGPLHSYRRSVVGFALNIVEVALVAGALDALLDCSRLAAFDAWWTHLGRIVSLDGADVINRFGVCRAVPVARFAFGVLLMLLALATLAGGLIREEVDKTPRSP